MKVRKAKKSASDKRWAKQVARKDAEIDDLKTQLDKALALVNEQAQQIKTLTERFGQLENELAEAKNELAKAKKDSSNSSKPPVQTFNLPWICGSWLPDWKNL